MSAVDKNGQMRSARVDGRLVASERRGSPTRRAGATSGARIAATPRRVATESRGNKGGRSDQAASGRVDGRRAAGGNRAVRLHADDRAANEFDLRRSLQCSIIASMFALASAEEVEGSLERLIHELSSMDEQKRRSKRSSIDFLKPTAFSIGPIGSISFLDNKIVSPRAFVAELLKFRALGVGFPPFLAIPVAGGRSRRSRVHALDSLALLSAHSCVGAVR